MSESVTNFVFDLQRFAWSGWLSPESGSTQHKPKEWVHEAGYTPTEVGDKEITVWESDPGFEAGAYTKITFSSRSSDTFDYEAGSTTKSATYYTVDLDNATKLENFMGFEGGIKIGDITLEFGYDSSSSSNGKNDAITLKNGEMTAITLKSKNTTLGVVGADGNDFSINNKAVNVEGSKYTYIFVKSGGDNILDISEAGGGAVTKTGDAKKLYVAAHEAGDDGLQIGSQTFSYVGGGGYGEDGTGVAYFKVNNNAVTGFVFGEAGNAITVPSDANLSLYYAKGSKESAVPSALTVDGIDEYAVTADGEAGNITGFLVDVDNGANVTLGSTKFNFGLEGEHDDSKVKVGFSTKGSLTGVYGVALGDTVTVAGGPTLKAGVMFATESGANGASIKVASGNFIYSFFEDEDAGATVAGLTLTQDADTVLSMAGIGEVGATKVRVIPTSDGNTLTIGKDTFQFSNGSGAAYFVMDTESGTMASAFHFGDEGDAITFTGKTKYGEFGFTYDLGDEPTELDAMPSVSAKSYTVELTTLGDDAAGTQFQIADLADKTKVTFLGGDGGTLAFGGDGGIVLFNGEGTTSGLSVATGGSVTIDSTAAALLASDGDTPFSLNGSAISITGAASKGLVYDDKDKSLNGYDAGEVTVVDAGVVEKIFAPKGTGDTVTAFTFGSEGTQVVTTQSKSGKSFLNVDHDKATGYTFVDVGDAVSADFSDFKLYDGAEDTTGFAAPNVTDSVSGDAITTATIAKTKVGFQIEASVGNIVEFDDGTKLTFETLGEDAASLVFNTTGELVSIGGLTTADDKMIVENATGAVSIDSAVYQITGASGASWTYQMNTEDTPAPTIRDLTSGVKVTKSGNAEELWTKAGAVGTFAFGSASAFTVTGAEDDANGIQFLWDGSAATGISSIDDTKTSIAGALNGLTFNGNEEALGITDAIYTLVGGQSLAGLKAGTKITAQGGLSDFITIEEGKFTFGSEYEIKGDKEVTFTLGDLKLKEIKNLAGSAIGDFTGGLSVNGAAVQVTNDTSIEVIGNDTGITEIHQLGGKGVDVVKADNASLLGANEDGDFKFTFAGGASFTLAGNKLIETTFEIADGAVTAIEGLDKDEILAGSFSTAIKVEGKEIEIANDPVVSIVGGTSMAITGLGDGAEIKSAGGAKYAVTDEEGSFVIGGKSFAIKGDKEVTFELDANGNVVAINGVDNAATVSGALNGISINSGEAFDIRDNTNYSYSPNSGVSGVVDKNTIKSADGAKNVWVSGTDFTVVFENGAFSVAGETDGVNFLVKDTNIAIGVESLNSGATIAGDFSQLTTVNGISFAINDSDKSVSLVAGDTNLAQILGLTGDATVSNAGGASIAITDKAGKFTFGSQSAFTTGDDEEVTFALNTKGEVTAISGLSGNVTGNFSDITGINDKTFSVKDKDGVLTVYGNESADDLAKIAGVTGDATIGEVGSVSQILTDGEGKFDFTVGGQSFTTGDGAKEVTFGLSASKVVSIDKLSGSVVGSFSGIAVNGADIDIIENPVSDGKQTVFGDGTKLTAIQGVDADATINSAGGVAFLVGNIAGTSGAFTFSGNSAAFEINGDDKVTFALDLNDPAKVTGIAELKGAVVSNFTGVSSINTKTFEVEDADGVLKVYGNATEDDITKIESVSGGAVIGEIGSVSQVLTDKAGEFVFKNGSWSTAGDNEVTFGMSSSNVVSIAELTGTVFGAFEDVAVNGKTIDIAGDSTISVIGSASGVTSIERLCDGATIHAAEDVLTAKTYSEGSFTFADGRTIAIAGDSQVSFELDGRGNLVSIQDLEDDAIVSGKLNGISIGDGEKFSVAPDQELWYSNGTLSGVNPSSTVYSADGASTVQVDGNGRYTFGSETFVIDGDKDGIITFEVENGNEVTAINNLDDSTSITGPLNEKSINDGEALNIQNDDDFGAVVGSGSAIDRIYNLSDGASVIAAGGASQFVTDEEGDFNIYGTAMNIADDTSVVFTASQDGITVIDDLQGTATGDFREEIIVNDHSVKVLNDSVVAVTADSTSVTRVDNVSAGATVEAVGGANEVGTDTQGNFTFTTGGDSRVFTVEGDNAVTFALDDDGNVIGVSDFDEDGVLGFDAEIEELAVNDADLEIQTTTNASLSIVNGEVAYVQGVTDAISGLENATIAATKAMTVNGTDVNVEGDEDYKIIVAGGEVVGLAEVSGDATVNVEAAISIAADNSGEFEIGGENYSFNDEDNNFLLTTDAEGKLSGVNLLDGTMVIDQPAVKDLTINSNELNIVSAADSVTVATDGIDITAVTGLVSGDAVSGNLGSASIAMPYSAASVKGEGTTLTVNDVTYELLNDPDGITVTGGREVTDLDENASLFVDAKGKYTVNGNGSDIDVEDTNLPIIGLDNATDAYIYDPANLIIRKGTPVSSIEQMLGLPTEYPFSAGSEEAPLNNAGLSALMKEDLDRPLEIFASNDSKTLQEIDLADTDFSKKVHLYDGDQVVSFNNFGGNLAVIERENADGSETGGAKAVALGNGGDAVIMKADNSNGSSVGIIGGTGADTLVVQGSAPTTFNMSAGGDDIVMMFASANARVNLTGYDALANPNAGIRITERWTSDLATAINAGLLNFGNGRMTIGYSASSNSQVQFASDFNNFVNLYNYRGQKQAVGFSPDDGGLVDGSTSSDPLILLGNRDGNKTGNSTLRGGSGDDTAIGGAGDNIDLGSGNNQVVLQDSITRGGATVNIAAGRTTISNFNGTFNGDHADRINVDLTAAEVSFDGTNVQIAGSAFNAVIANAKVDGAISYDSADLAESADLVESADEISTSLRTAEGDYTNVLFNSNGVDVKTAVAKTNGVVDVKLDFDARALNYIGDNSGLTLYDHTGEVFINLADGMGSIDTDTALFSGFNKVAAGAGQTTVIGSAENETLIAGTGNDSVYGAGGKNLLVGHSEAGKTGQTSFFVVAENDGAANTIQSFNFVDDDSWSTNTNKITADVLDIQVQYDYINVNNDVDISGDDVVLFVNNRNKNSTESVILQGARGKDFIVSGNGVVNDVIAQVNTDSLVADEFANLFAATGKNATLSVSNDIDSANIYLGGRPLLTDYDGIAPEFYGDFAVIDARGAHATAELGGNDRDNVIYAGSGNTSLWGGNGGNDLLVGGTGADTFFYNLGNGDDTIANAGSGDVVDLSTITIDQIVGEIGTNGVVLNFNDGGKLTVDSTDVEFKVSGATYVVEDGEWKTK